MSWIGLQDEACALFSASGLTAQGAALAADAGREAPGACLSAGTLFIEARHPGQEPLKLIAASGAEFWPAQVMLHLWPQGRATLQIGDGAAGLQLVTGFSRCAPGEPLRLMFRWSAAFNAAWLSVESPGRGMFAISRRAGPPPIPLAMLEQIFALPKPDNVGMMALSDRAEDIGFGASLAAGSPVRTPFGWRPVEDLRPGDLVNTADGGAVAVREIARRVLPWSGSFAPVALDAAKGPVHVSPKVRVLVPGNRPGREVLVKSAEISGSAEPPAARFLTYVDPMLDRAHLINVGGLWIETRAPAPGPVTRQSALVQYRTTVGAA